MRAIVRHIQVQVKGGIVVAEGIMTFAVIVGLAGQCS